MIEHRLLRSICHASVGTNNLTQAKSFYTPILAILGIELVSEYEHAVAYGKGYPEFWLQLPFDKKLATASNGVHFGFVALNKQQVDDFYQCAITLGGRCNGEPGARPEYGEPYYGCFIIDLDGNKIEASYWQVADK
ncbi:MAG: catechol 2,3-dioxygenase-like lactoylglutathione lyase family enzyme [Colwellia sp.]|jgi:catechol 2,3-dioxygenase-like lactoylglutathione lyase family enzyme